MFVLCTLQLMDENTQRKLTKLLHIECVFVCSAACQPLVLFYAVVRDGWRQKAWGRAGTGFLPKNRGPDYTETLRSALMIATNCYLREILLILGSVLLHFVYPSILASPLGCCRCA